MLKCSRKYHTHKSLKMVSDTWMPFLWHVLVLLVMDIEDIVTTGKTQVAVFVLNSTSRRRDSWVQSSCQVQRSCHVPTDDTHRYVWNHHLWQASFTLKVPIWINKLADIYRTVFRGTNSLKITSAVAYIVLLLLLPCVWDRDSEWETEWE